MSLFLHIAQGNARRVTGKKRPAKLPARISLLRGRIVAWAHYPNTERSDH